jgi:asparagine synthase (glutamine-hydrolysing)
VLYAYDEWGAGCIERVRGMFALAIWDERERCLLLARDRMGIKPLYRAQDADCLAFGSEVRTLLLGGLVAPELSAAGVQSFLRLGAVQEPHTILHGVSQVPPGHFEVWKDGRVSTHAYWSLESAFRAPEASLSRANAVEMIRDKLEEAIGIHLVSDVPLGVFLSGGIDSSALVGLVTHMTDEPPHTVSVVFPQQDYTEDRYITAITKRYRTQHTSVHLDAQAVVDYVPEALKAMDQPTIDGVNTFIVSSLARHSGLTVALSGVGGDELFGGYDTFRVVPRLVAMQRRAPSGLRSIAARILDLAGRTSDRDEKLKQWLRGNERGLDAAYALRRELFGPAVAAELQAGGMGSSGGLAGLLLPSELPDELNTMSYYELAVYMENMLLRDTDVMSMANSLEVRVPLLDHELVELVARMPGKWKVGTAPPKPLLVDALRDLIPAETSQRKKMGFTLPYEHWLRGPLRSQVEDALLDEGYGGAASALLNGDEVRNIWKRFCAGDAYWTRPWALFVLKSWGERHRCLLSPASVP